MATTTPSSTTSTNTLTTHTLTLKTLDQTRLRLFQLTNALSSLHRDLLLSDPLPPPSTLQKTSQLLSHHLTSLSSFLASPAVHDALARTTAYPLPALPWAEAGKEAVLTQLLRKKVDPGVGDWVDGGAAAASAAAAATATAAVGGGIGGGGLGTTAKNEERLGLQELEELWAWAKPRAGELAAGMPWGTDFSVAEREGGIENVGTGIRRALNTGDEDDDDDDDDDDDEEDDDNDDDWDGDEEGGAGGGAGAGAGVADKMQGIQKAEVKGRAEEREREKGKQQVPLRPMVPLEEMLKYMSTGVAPRGGSLGRLGAPGVGPPR